MAGSEEPSADLRLAIEALELGLIDAARLLKTVRAWTEPGGRRMAEILSGPGGVNATAITELEARLRRGLGVEHPEDAGATATFVEGRSVARAAGARAGGGRTLGSEEGRFEVLRPHARGGLGEVSVAHDRELNRRVALKELQASLAHDPASQARFLFEAEVTGQLEHPGIVPVYSLGRYADGRPYYAMHLVEGETLRSAIERYHVSRSTGEVGDEVGRDLEFRRLLRSVIDACNAVAYAHDRGVVHRDLKPENIMLGRFGQTLVLDWGVAKRLSGNDERSPAIELGEAGAEESMTQPGSVLGTPRYMSPEQAGGDLDRMGTASDIYSLGAVLYCVLVGRDPFAGGGRESVLNRVRRGIFPAPRRVRRSIDPALEAICLKAMALEPGERHGSALELAGKLEAWLADVRFRGEQEVALNEVKEGLARLCVERAQHCFGKEMRGEGMLWLARALESAPEEPAELPRLIRTSLWGWHVGGKLLERSLRHTCDVHAIALCHEGRRLATACEDGARLWDVSTGLTLGRPLVHTGAVRDVQFSKDGRRLASAGDDGSARCWDATTGEPIGEAMELGRSGARVRFSADGSKLAATSRAGLPFLWDAATGRPLRGPDPAHGDVLSVAFGPCGECLAVGFEDGAVLVLEQNTGWRAEAPLEHGSAVSILEFDSLGERLLAGSVGGELRVWHVEPRRAVGGHSFAGDVRCAAFRPGGDAIVVAGGGGGARLWSPDTGRPMGGPMAHGGRVDCVVFHPDGTLVATGGDGVLRFWCAASGLAIGPPLAQPGAMRGLVFSGDGRRLATCGGDRTVRCWKAPEEVEGEAERISCWVRLSTELDFDAGDAVRRLEGGESLELRRRLIDLGGEPLR
jgi:serine/threonine protein kinase/WD40 repeat protein